MAMQRDDEDTDTETTGRKKATLRFPIELHRWYRHRAVDGDTTFELAVLNALDEWARNHGYSPTSDSSSSRA